VKSIGGEEIGRDLRDLYAYHDGELGGLRRWLFERRLERSSALRSELEALERLTRCVRASEPPPPSVDVWDEIALRLPAINAQSDSQPRTRDRRWQRRVERWGWRDLDWLATYSRPLAAVAVSVALALALFLGIMEGGGAPAAPGMIRWLDTGGRSVMVLEDQGDATIVWLLDAPEDRASDGRSREAV